jgi:hypothetical protein
MRIGALATMLALAALAIGAAGCGSDDESEPTTVPTISVPSGEVQTVPESKTTTTAPEQTTTSGSGGTKVNPNKPDSPTNDIPPQPGTPESKFEQYCDQNPGACG